MTRGRNANTPRLSKVDRDQLADDVVRAVTRHAKWSAGVVGSELFENEQRPRRCEPDEPDLPFGMLRDNIRRLAGHAKGDELWDDVEESIRIVSRAVWTRACDEDPVEDPVEAPGEVPYINPDSLLPDIDPDSLLDDWQGRLFLVVRGASARTRLDKDENMTPVEVSILAGQSANHIRLMCRKKRIDCIRIGPNRWLISADSARAWIKRIGGDQ